VKYKILATRVEQHKISKSHPAWKLIDDYCFRSKNLYNYANYIIRQEFINNGKWIHYNELFDLCKNGDDYKNLGSNLGQQTLRLLDKNWKSFFAAIKDWKKNPSKYLGRPKLPKYKAKDGRCFLGIDNIKFFNTDGHIRFGYKPFHCLNNMFKTNISSTSKLMQCRFIPYNNYYTMEIVYQIEAPDQPTESTNIASIDLGIDNFATITNNIGLQPIAIKGKVIKSINQYFNKKKASIQSELMLVNEKHWSKRLQKLTDKRNNKVRTWMHNVSKYIVDYCVLYGIDTLVCGYNVGWKQESKMSKKVNQKFVSIPFDMFVNQLKYKCENNGIRFIQTEESYTSGTSFLDGESPVKENYNKSRRIYRGTFQSNDDILINSDVNGSYQIMKKVFPNAFVNGIEGVGCHPTAIKIV
jgi:putative transposase